MSAENPNLGFGNPSRPHLDAVALIEAQRRHDGVAIAAIVDAADGDDLASLALVLAQMVCTACGPDRLRGFLALQVDKTLEHAHDDDAP